ncbi:RNase H domain-containing protein [Trichonephila clavipes]|nr:RNase H domain-containing protein [Trichonephila clavipes]
MGNEQADIMARLAMTLLPLAVPLSDIKRVIPHHISTSWQESWSQQLANKLHYVKPVIGTSPVKPMRRADVKLTRLRVGHTLFTHRHLLLGRNAPEGPSCKTLKRALSSEPVLGMYDENHLTEIHINANGYGIGAVLVKIQNKVERL